jgi:hypothetical protein
LTGWYCLLCQSEDPPRLEGEAALHRHLLLEHGCGQAESGRDFLVSDLAGALRRRGQMTLDDLVLERFQLRLAAVAGGDDFLLDCRAEGHSGHED